MNSVVYLLLVLSVTTPIYGEDAYYHQVRNSFNPHSNQNKGLLDSLDPFESTIESLASHLAFLTGGIYNELTAGSSIKQIGYVRHSSNDDVCDEEKRGVYQRKQLVRTALQALLPDQSINTHGHIPTIALCLSGGGFRAMVSSFGFLQGLDDIGLLECITYISCLSGSTWAIAPWIASKKPLNSYIKSLSEKLKEGIRIPTSPLLALPVLNTFIEKVIYFQPISLMDLYALLLAHTLLPELNNKKFNATISDTHSAVHQGIYPIPIYTAISVNRGPYEWFEITPYEVGNSSTQSYVPLWAFGRRFRAGQSLDTAQEQSLAHFLAVFGSAFEVDILDYIRLMGPGILVFETSFPNSVDRALKKIIDYLVYSLLPETRLLPARFFNYMYRHPQSCLFMHDKHITLVDAGIDCNIPLVPLLRPSRSIDIVIIFDASAEDWQGISELQRAYQYASFKQIPLPPCSFEKIQEDHVTIIPSNHPLAPTIIYIPLKQNKTYSKTFNPQECINNGYAHTYNFTYTSDEIMQLKELPRHTIVQAKQDIMQPIIAYIQKSTS